MLAKNNFGAIVDPFHPIHGYTSILPIKMLKIPEWTWQEALSRMTAFFHFGPLTVIRDVPEYDERYLLTAKTDDMKDNKKVFQNGASLPKMGTGDWAWLQPYSRPKEDGSAETSFMSLGIAGAETQPTFDNEPYTSVEGYLQLSQSIIQGQELDQPGIRG
jgi:hypothetical protein